MSTTRPTPAEVLPAAAERGPLVLEAHALAKDYRLSRGPRGVVLSAVRDVSFGLYRSAVVALVGESGSGKSTVAKMLAGQERPTGGEILLEGVAVQPWKRGAFRAYKSDVQMIFQDPFASLNAGAHGALRAQPARAPAPAREGQGGGRRRGRASARARATDARRAASSRRYPHELSGGQRQRVAIARALAARPRVLLADEPVSMLDVSIRLEVLDLLDELRSQFELAVLYVTHDIASARYFADDTLVMYAGEIVERGPSEDVTQRPAHPYTQLLVASAPDPDQLGEPLEDAPSRSAAARGKRAVEHRRLPLRAALPVRRRSLPRRVTAAASDQLAAGGGLLAARRGRARLAPPRHARTGRRPIKT